MSGVFLTSAGVVCHAGRGLAALYDGLINPMIRPRRRPIDEITLEVAVPYLPADFSTAGNRVMGLVEAAMQDALAAYTSAQRQDMALFIASSTADLVGNEPDYAAAIARGEPALSWREPGAGLLGSRIAEKFAIRGGQYTINTACSSGVHALMYAAAAIRRGDCKRALVVGLECPGRVTLAGFNSLLLVTPTRCRPFDRDRDGLIPGEAVAAVVVEAEPEGPAFSGMRLLGAATTCDTSGVIQTDASSVRALMDAAMRNAQIDHVDAIKAHGTGTPDSDRAEAAGIMAYMGNRRTPVTSIKPVLGHTLGACGVLETLAMAVCWQEGRFPATSNFQTPDPELGLTPEIAPPELPPGRMLLNYFGFGGNNGVLALEYAP